MMNFEHHTSEHPRHKLAQALVVANKPVPNLQANIGSSVDLAVSNDNTADIFYNPSVAQLDAIFSGTLKGY